MTNPSQEFLVVSVFGNVEAFSTALEELVASGFHAADISILGNHQSLLDHFGTIPNVDELSDRMDTPRDNLETHQTLGDVVDVLSNTMAIVAQIGSAAAAFAVGGPIGVSTGAAAEAEENLGGFLARISDAQWHHRLEQSVSDGGIICWVRAQDDDTAKSAAAILAQAGGDHIHRTDPLPPTVWPID